MFHYENLSIENIDGEIWKSIPDAEGYEASNKGRFKSTIGYFKSKPKEYILKQHFFGDYLIFTIKKNGKRFQGKSHRMICFVFNENNIKLGLREKVTSVNDGGPMELSEEVVDEFMENVPMSVRLAKFRTKSSKRGLS